VAAGTGLAAAALVGAGTLVGAELHDGSTRPAPPATAETVSAADPTTHVWMQADLQQRPWGTAVQVSLQGVTPGENCRLVAVARDGRQEVAATWQATYEGRAEVTGATAIPADELSALRIVATDGRPLVSAPGTATR
jgi:hypothetical protein